MVPVMDVPISAVPQEVVTGRLRLLIRVNVEGICRFRWSLIPPRGIHGSSISPTVASAAVGSFLAVYVVCVK